MKEINSFHLHAKLHRAWNHSLCLPLQAQNSLNVQKNEMWRCTMLNWSFGPKICRIWDMTLGPKNVLKFKMWPFVELFIWSHFSTFSTFFDLVHFWLLTFFDNFWQLSTFHQLFSTVLQQLSAVKKCWYVEKCQQPLCAENGQRMCRRMRCDLAPC